MPHICTNVEIVALRSLDRKSSSVYASTDEMMGVDLDPIFEYCRPGKKNAEHDRK